MGWGWGIIRQRSGKAFLRGALEWSAQGWEHRLVGPAAVFVQWKAAGRWGGASSREGKDTELLSILTFIGPFYSFLSFVLFFFLVA